MMALCPAAGLPSGVRRESAIGAPTWLMNLCAALPPFKVEFLAQSFQASPLRFALSLLSLSAFALMPSARAAVALAGCLRRSSANFSREISTSTSCGSASCFSAPLLVAVSSPLPLPCGEPRRVVASNSGGGRWTPPRRLREGPLVAECARAKASIRILRACSARFFCTACSTCFCTLARAAWSCFVVGLLSGRSALPPSKIS